MIDKSILTDFFNESVCFEPPKTLKNVLNKFDIEETVTNKPIIDEVLSDVLSFFKLSSLTEIYCDTIENSQDTIIYSPDIFEQSLRVNNTIKDACGSPILGKYSQRVKNGKPNLQKLKTKIDSPTKFSMNKTKISSTPQVKEPVTNLQLDDLCDVSSFGLDLATVPSLLQSKDCSTNVVNVLGRTKVQNVFDTPSSSQSFNLNMKINTENKQAQNKLSRKNSLSSLKTEQKHPSLPSKSYVTNLSELDSFQYSFNKPNTPIKTDYTGKVKSNSDNSTSNITLISKTSKTEKNQPNYSQSQFGITQLLSLINEPSQSCAVNTSNLDSFKDPFNKPNTPIKTDYTGKAKSISIPDLLQTSPKMPQNKSNPDHSRSNFNLIPKNSKTEKNQTSCSQSQVGITQLMSLINEPSQSCAAEIKTIEDICDLDSFNFSFNKPKTPIKTEIPGKSKPTSTGEISRLSFTKKLSEESVHNSTKDKIIETDFYQFTFNEKKTPNNNRKSNSDTPSSSCTPHSPKLMCARSLFSTAESKKKAELKTNIPTSNQHQSPLKRVQVENGYCSEDEFEPKPNRLLERRKPPDFTRDSKKAKNKVISLWLVYNFFAIF